MSTAVDIIVLVGYDPIEMRIDLARCLEAKRWPDRA